MTFEAIPKTTSFQWVFPADEKPLHKEIVFGRTQNGTEEVWYSVRECGWFNMNAQSIKVVLWKKVLHIDESTHVISTRFFKRTKV